MNIAKHMEIIFIGALALASATSLASAAAPAHRTVAPTLLQTASTAPIAVVTIAGKRLSAAHKAQLGS